MPAIGQPSCPRWVYLGDGFEGTYDVATAQIKIRHRSYRFQILSLTVLDFEHEFPELPTDFWLHRLPLTNSHRSLW